MLRSDVIAGFLALHEDCRYLEIGVDTGQTFHALNAERKVAVDPHFKFSPNPDLQGHEYYEVPSDDYFGKIARESDVFDVIYVDGLHTVEQTLRDLLNAVDHLSQDGVIIVDDVIPSSFSASLPALQDVEFVRTVMPTETDMSYMGDVYRLVFFVETFMQGWNYATIAENHGQLVMWRSTRESVRERTVEGVGRMDLVTMFREYESFRRMPLAEIVAHYRDGRQI